MDNKIEKGTIVEAWDDDDTYRTVGYYFEYDEASKLPHRIACFSDGDDVTYYTNVSVVPIKEPVYRLKPLKELMVLMLDNGYEPYLDGKWYSNKGYAEEITHGALLRSKNREIVHPDYYPKWMLDKSYE